MNILPKSDVSYLILVFEHHFSKVIFNLLKLLKASKCSHIVKMMCTDTVIYNEHCSIPQK